MAATKRDKVEKILLEYFPGVIKPLENDDIPIINKFKDGSFGFSYLGLMLYANGQNERGKSTFYPRGLIYHDGDSIFGIGYYKKDFSEPNGHIHIIAPKGRHWLKAVNNFVTACKTIKILPKSSLYIRHLDSYQYQKLLNAGFNPITIDPWNSISPSEDETFNHRFIEIKDIVDYDKNGNAVVKILKTKDSRNFRRKAKSAYNRFNNFLKRNNFIYQIEEYDVKLHKRLSKKFIIDHFKSLKNTIGSTPEDYFNLINYIPAIPKGCFYGYIGFLIRKRKKIPISLFIGEKTNRDTVALYATFALRNESEIQKNNFLTTGFSALSQYCFITIFDCLKKENYKYVDLGGSEIKSLNEFKRQLGAQEKITYWAVKK